MDAVSGAPHDGGRGHQQVMSAQAQPTSQLNGTDGPRTSGVIGGSEATGSAALRAEGTNAGHGSSPPAEASQPREAPASSGLRPPVSLEARAAQGQVESMATPTIDDAGGRPVTGIAAEFQGPAAAHDFFTPRSRSPGNGGQNNWFGRSMAENWPRWMNRLGSYLAVGQDPLAPSPLTGDTPPGGRSFLLRSPQRAARPLTLPRPSMPPSSSVPAEAIQQEVQRQLAGIRNVQGARGGLLGDLVSAPSGPGYLSDARRLLRDLASAPSGPGDPADARRLLGDLASAPPGLSEQPGARRLLGDLASAPSGQSVCQDRGGSLHDPVLGPNRARGDQGVGSSGFNQARTMAGGSMENSGALQRPDLPPEPRGLLRSLLGGARQRSQSPTTAPRRHSLSHQFWRRLHEECSNYNNYKLKPLLREVGRDKPESLKAGTTSLTQLPDREGGAEASIRFNDWLEITTTAMTDVSERSGQWWAAMLLVVRAAYTRWLSATHLERLAISPEAWTSCAVTHGAE